MSNSPRRGLTNPLITCFGLFCEEASGNPSPQGQYLSELHPKPQKAHIKSHEFRSRVSVVSPQHLKHLHLSTICDAIGVAGRI